MSAEKTIAIVTKVFTHIESAIKLHFEKVDKNNILQPIIPGNLADELVKKYGLKPAECIQIINLYVNQSEHLELRTGKNSGIYRVTDEKPKAIMGPKECALKHYDVVKEHAVDVIGTLFLAEEENEKTTGKATRLNFQELCEKIANKIGVKNYTVYFCLREYIERERPDLKIERGREGGVMKNKKA